VTKLSYYPILLLRYGISTVDFQSPVKRKACFIRVFHHKQKKKKKKKKREEKKGKLFLKKKN